MIVNAEFKIRYGEGVASKSARKLMNLFSKSSAKKGDCNFSIV
jgi:hypothetical protein